MAKRNPYKSAGSPTKMKQFLDKRGLLQSEVVKLTGLSTGTVSKAIKSDKMSPDTLIRLTERLDALPTDLTNNNRLIIATAAKITSDPKHLEFVAQAAAVAIQSKVTKRK